MEAAADPDRSVAEVCREYGISRRTGYKWIKRHKDRGELGLCDRSRRPHSRPLETNAEMALRVIELRRDKPRRGPKKIHQLLLRAHGDEAPSQRTIARILERAGLVRRITHRNKAKARPATAPTVKPQQPNDLWTLDFKGWWRSTDGTRCEPLTVRDAVSRYVLAVRLVRTTHDAVRAVMEELFRTYGLPRAILSDNGQPFACTRALAGLSRLSAWWVSLGIEVYRSRPGCPQDNGAHERLHVDMRFELEDEPAATLEQQQHACEQWRVEFNTQRPHEALDMKMPAEVYHRSDRRPSTQAIGGYPDGCAMRRVCNGSVEFLTTRIWVSKSIEGYQVGLLLHEDATYHVYFYHLLVGQITVGQGVHVVPIEADVPDDSQRKAA